MKKILILFIIILLTGCSDEKLENNDSNNINSKVMGDEIIKNKDIVYKVTSYADYLYIFPNELYNTSDLIVLGTFKSNIKTYITDYGNVYTMVEFKIEEILNGNEDKKNITVSYKGGIVTLKEFLEVKTKEEIKKYGLEDINPEGKYVEFVEKDKKIKLDKNKKYLLFLNKDSNEISDYISVSNGYSILEVIDNKIFDEYTKEYITIDSLKK